jgi:hypothetical protein
MSSYYYLSAQTSDLSGGADFNRVLSRSIVGLSLTLSVPVAFGGAIEASFAWTPAGDIPLGTSFTGTYTIAVTIATGNSNGRLAIAVDVVDSADALVIGFGATAEQTTTAGTKTFSITTPNYILPESSGYRLKVRYQFRNVSAMTNITLGLTINEPTAAYVIVPWNKRAYWVGGTDTWDAFPFQRWATTSGGSGGSAFAPDGDTDVFFDSNSGSGTVTIGSSGNFVVCASLNCTGFAGTFVNGTAGSEFGMYCQESLTLSSGMTVTSFPNLVIRKGTLTTAGKTLANVYFDDSGAGNTLTLGGSLSAGGRLQITSGGTLTVGANNVALESFVYPNSVSATLNMGSGTWTFIDSATSLIWDMTAATLLTLNTQTASIVINNTGATAKIFNAGARTYSKLTYNNSGTGALSIEGSGASFTDQLSNTSPSSAYTINFDSGATINVAAWNINGTASANVSLRASSAGTRFTLNKTGGGTVTANYLDIKDSAGTPTSTWTAQGSIDSGNNTGWTFAAIPIVNNGKFFLAF